MHYLSRLAVFFLCMEQSNINLAWDSHWFCNCLLCWY